MYGCIDFNMVKIDTILVECDSSDVKKNERVVNLLRSKGSLSYFGLSSRFIVTYIHAYRMQTIIRRPVHMRLQSFLHTYIRYIHTLGSSLTFRDINTYIHTQVTPAGRLCVTLCASTILSVLGYRAWLLTRKTSTKPSTELAQLFTRYLRRASSTSTTPQYVTKAIMFCMFLRIYSMHLYIMHTYIVDYIHQY